MPSSYVIEVEVYGIPLDSSKPFESVTGPKLVDSLVRDDGTGILWFEFDPPADDDGAQTWNSAKDYVETVRSAVVGSDIGVATCNVVLREAPEPKVKASSAPARKPSAEPAKSADRPADHKLWSRRSN